MALNNATAAFIGASVTLFLVIVFMILMVILVRQCLAFLAKRNAIRAQNEQQLEARRQFERQRRGSVTEPVPATFDWHHSIRIAGTPPPSYVEAKGLPAFDATVAGGKKKRVRRERDRGPEQTDNPEVIANHARSVSVGEENSEDSLQVNNAQRRHTSPHPAVAGEGELQSGGVPSAVELENQRNCQMMTTELVQVAVDIETSSAEEFEVISGEGGRNRSAHQQRVETL